MNNEDYPLDETFDIKIIRSAFEEKHTTVKTEIENQNLSEEDKKRLTDRFSLLTTVVDTIKDYEVSFSN